ncbi:hypothetical protein KOR42_20530 [Thalassoglobus neptunius]|uniref:Uncharacterized protein n=1 Tax=Thalassoglobus neptunius TaxID=1938619 RepID=A0A5C5X8J1_9PLAN|nr:hypothetical protein [Thalassoglobus neptunius]TWT58671.1 hypothetical protein KOR42_20530 [Thalassoglobus neptunius]
MRITTSTKRLGLSLVLIACFGIIFHQTTLACPFCMEPQRTLTEYAADAEFVAVAVFVDRDSSDEATSEDVPVSGWRIEKVLKSKGKLLSRGDSVRSEQLPEARSNDRYLIFGQSDAESVKWNSIVDSNLRIELYFQGLLETRPDSRLKYCIDHLEHSDPEIAMDAYSEFAKVSATDVAALRESLPRVRLREWIDTVDESPGRWTRVGLYGLMLGYCGEAEDADFLAETIFRPTTEVRIGLNGLIAGYLLLTSEDGLTQVDEKFLDNPAATRDARFSTMQALRFLWESKDHEISPDRLKNSMRKLLKNPELAMLAVIDLTRWQDWDALNLIDELRNSPDHSDSATQRTIVRYLLAAADACDSEANPGCHEIATKAKQLVEEIRMTNPQLVRFAERSMFD